MPEFIQAERYICLMRLDSCFVAISGAPGQPVPLQAKNDAWERDQARVICTIEWPRLR